MNLISSILRIITRSNSVPSFIPRWIDIEEELKQLPIVTDGREKADGGLVHNRNLHPMTLREAALEIARKETFENRAETRSDHVYFGHFWGRTSERYYWYRISETSYVKNSHVFEE